LKTNDENRLDFEDKWSHKHSRMPYYSIPGEMLLDSSLLKEWAERAIAASK